MLPSGNLVKRSSTRVLSDAEIALLPAGCPRRVAQAMAYCLRHAGAIEMVGKRGNAIEYGLTPAA